MKTTVRFSNKTRSILSVLVFGIFLVLAAGSLDLLIPLGIEVSTVKYPDGNYHEVEKHANACQTISRYGKRDVYGRWHGWLSIKYLKSDDEIMYEEKVYMVHGRRNGICTRKYPDGRTEEEHYISGIKVSEKKKAAAANDEESAFDILEKRHPWFLFILEGFRYPHEFVEDYTDTLETLLDTYTFGPDKFDTYYDQVQDSLGRSRFDSLMESTRVLTFSIGLGKAKDDELRLAVIDRFRSGGSTYPILESFHPSYMNVMNDSGVDPSMLEVFCSDLDDTLDLFEPIDPEDAFFTDSVDAHLYAALSALLSTGDLKSAQLQPADTISAYVANKALSMMMLRLLEGDLIRKVVYDHTLAEWGIARPPMTGTEFLGSTSASARLKGYVMEEGGTPVTERGIAWAVHYNPTVSDQVETAGTGQGDFEVTIDGVVEGQMYFARTYATNSTGTAYGNIISFVPKNAVSSGSEDLSHTRLWIFPNPVSTEATIRYDGNEGKALAIVITDLSGRSVWNMELPAGTAGPQEIRVDLSELTPGLYHCMVMGRSSQVLAQRKLVIIR